MTFTILVVPYMQARGERVMMAGCDPARFQVLMGQIRTQMVFAESLEYGGFCMTEQHMQVEGIETTTNPLFWDYFEAQHTKKMRVGQLGMNLTAVNPIQLAENIAMLDHFTAGRVFAGFSRGNTPLGGDVGAAFGCDVDGVGPVGGGCAHCLMWMCGRSMMQGGICRRVRLASC